MYSAKVYQELAPRSCIMLGCRSQDMHPAILESNSDLIESQTCKTRNKLGVSYHILLARIAVEIATSSLLPCSGHMDPRQGAC